MIDVLMGNAPQEVSLTWTIEQLIYKCERSAMLNHKIGCLKTALIAPVTLVDAYGRTLTSKEEACIDPHLYSLISTSDNT